MGPGVDLASSENEYREHFLAVKAVGAWGWQPHHLHVANVMKSGSLNFLEHSGPHRACYGTPRNKWPDYLLDTGAGVEEKPGKRGRITHAQPNASYPFRKKCTVTEVKNALPTEQMFLWKMYNAAWPFRCEPSSDQALPIAAMYSVTELSKWFGHYRTCVGTSAFFYDIFKTQNIK